MTRRPRLDLPILVPSRSLLLACTFVALPCLAALGWHLSIKSQERAHIQDACRAFVNGQPGWQTREQLSTSLDRLDLEIRAVAAKQYEAIKAEFQTRLSAAEEPRTYGLYALPLYQNLNWRQGVQQFIGSQIRLSSATLPHSPEGSEALFVQLPFDPGTTAFARLDTPCGSYRQAFLLTLTPEQKPRLIVRTTGPGARIADQALDIAAP